jgi:hypothetical protein
MIASSSADLELGSIYVHAKGDRYMLISVALREADLEPLAIYAPLQPEALGFSISFARPVSEFRDRFSLDHGHE